MKNIQPYIIAGMTIIIVVLCLCIENLNHKNDVQIFLKDIELKEMRVYKNMLQKQVDSAMKIISVKSTETVKKSNSIIKKIQHEKPIIIDTTDNYMYQYISTYRPKQD